MATPKKSKKPPKSTSHLARVRGDAADAAGRALIQAAIDQCGPSLAAIGAMLGFPPGRQSNVVRAMEEHGFGATLDAWRKSGQLKPGYAGSRTPRKGATEPADEA